MIHVTRQIGNLTIIPDAIFDRDDLDADSKLTYIYLCRLEQFEDESDAVGYLTRMTSKGSDDVEVILSRLQNDNIIARSENVIDLIDPSEWKWQSV
jgi:hypothetical protein